ncbi:MAG: PilN domain-containing protein [Desulfobacteraceae bacterium]|nr:PilN domain-containing protein [Desulfobacteraceae bacterium]
MIRINLLPFRAARKRENIRQQVSIFVLLIIFLILGLSYYSIHLDKKIKIIETNILRVDNEIALYKEKAKRVNEIKKAMAIYEKKVGTIKSLKSRRREVIVLLDSMTELIIPEKMWLTDLKTNKTTVEISGIAFDQKTVADFMTKLGESPLFDKDIRLNNLKMDSIANEATVQNFIVSCTKTVKQTEKKTKE